MGAQEEERRQRRQTRPRFGDPRPAAATRRSRGQPAPMFPEGSDLPLFSGTPQSVTERPFVPEATCFKQQVLPGMPPIDYEQVYRRDRELHRPRRSEVSSAGSAEGLWDSLGAGREREPHGAPGAARPDTADQAALHRALAMYNLRPEELRHLAAIGGSLQEALRQGEAPEALHHLITALSHLLRPRAREQIKSPADVAALLLVQMGHLDQEELRTVLLDTKNRVQDIVTVYRGSLNTSMVRIGEVFKAALRQNSAALIVAHNHPSGDPTPSPEDAQVTREIVAAGELLDVDVLDHLVIGQGKWVSMRERGLGFS